MKRAHKIRIYPNNVRRTALLKHCECARLAYNACLAKWNEDYANGIKHNYYSVKKWFNGIKGERYPFVYEASKWACEAAIANLSAAFNRMYAKQNNHPKFHKKGIHDSFRIDGSAIKVNGRTLSLPKGLKIRMSERLRYSPLKIYNVTVSRKSDMWFASIQCEVPDSENQAEGIIGVDLGVKSQAALSDGTIYPNLGIRKKYERRIARATQSGAQGERKR